MCGIAGMLYADTSRLPEPLRAQAMGKAIAHRGPDADGVWQEPGVALVHRRLSIIDLAGGNQPLGNEDDSVQVVFNGEIYNFQELRARLLGRGHTFRTRSDTEVLVHLYEEHGPDLVDHLRGMFAFALWDRRRHRLLLARDRLGIKPLYYYRDAEKLVFGSELKAVLAHPAVPRRLDVVALEDYLAHGMVTGSRSILEGVQKLPPAHVLDVTPHRLDAPARRYWSLRFEPDPRPTVSEWQEAVRAKVSEAVRMHLIADVPVGVFLSGGIDSSVIAAVCSELGVKDLQSFSIGFEEAEFSELPHARKVAQRFGLRHVEELVTPDAVHLLDELGQFYDEPFADSSSIPTFLVSRLAARHVKVVLSGDGGDEAFGGYRRYVHDLWEDGWRRRLPRWLRGGVLGPLASVWPKADWLPSPLRAKTALTNLSRDADAAYANTLQLCRLPLRTKLLHPDLFRLRTHPDVTEPVRRAFRAAPSGDTLAGMIAADVEVVLPDDYLVKVDRASMACGLEVRPPLLDHELLELTARIPSSLKIRDGQTKWVFREAYRDRLPEEILSRGKQGFELPVDRWLRGPLVPMFEELVLDRQGKLAELIDLDVASGLFRAHRSGTGKHGPTLWGLLVLARWADRYLTNPLGT